ncbi:MAG: VanW family protein [Eubacterium sp.]
MKRQISIIISSVFLLIISVIAFNAYAQESAPVSINSSNTVVTVLGENQKFDYTSKKPEISVSFTDGNGKTVILKKDVDYKAVYANNKNAGKATINISGINNYTGVITKTFNISKHSFSKDKEIDCVLAYTETTYTGKAKTPTVTLYYTKNGKNIKLKKNEDYKVEYSNNTDAGKAKVTITGINNFSGKITKTFSISKYSLSGKLISVSLAYTKTTYSGKNKTPTVTVKYKKDNTTVKLKKNVDYTVSYSNNLNPGKATVKITGKGNFKGTVNKEFIILPKTVSNVKASDITSTSAKISWKKQENISGYELLVYDSKKKKYVHSKYIASDKSSVTLSKLNTATVYKYKIRAYKTVGKTKKYGNYSKELTVVTKPSQVKLTSVTKSSTKLNIEWSTVRCSGYEIFYSTDESFKKNVKSVKVNGSSKKSYTVKNVSKSKTYYVKVRAFYKYNDKYYYGQKSSRLSTYYSNLYATYTSEYENNPDRTNNLKIASKAISGTIVGVGETFSFNSVVGPRTAAKGYKSAHIFSGGGVVSGVGGGICQVASTMFNCALKANVSIVERHQHSQRVAYVPLGRDAAIYGNTQDFKWRNNTKYPIKVVMTVKDGKITCSFYTCEKAKPESVKLSVTQSGNTFTLKRSVNGNVNYTCKSTY